MVEDDLKQNPDGTLDDKLASEWEAMSMEGDEQTIQGVAATETNVGTRILNQEEIDSLLGFDESIINSETQGIEAILNSSQVSYERLPMLEVVFDRLVRLLKTTLRNFTADNVEVNFDGIETIRFGDYLNSIPLPAMMSVFQAIEWENYGLLMVDSSLIYSVLDILLGGRKKNSALRVEGRPYTTIERTLIQRMISLVLADLSAAFDPVTPVTFRLDRLETNPRFVTLVRPGNAVMVVKLRIEMDYRGGNLDIMLPYATLEPVRDVLLQMFVGEKFGRDSIWENHLADELLKTNVTLDVLLGEARSTLTEVFDWQVGSTLMLNAEPDSTITLRCGNVPLFSGKMGQKNKHLAIKIEGKVNLE
jgi:flagellar motor switch protein FliM